MNNLNWRYVCSGLTLCVSASSTVVADSKITLRSGSWELVSVPTEDLSFTFGDLTTGKLDVDTYFEDWGIFTFNLQTGLYEQPTLNTPIARNQGFWMIQYTGNNVVFESEDLEGLPSNPCKEYIGDRDAVVAAGCVVSLAPSQDSSIWSIVGLAKTQDFGSETSGIRIQKGNQCVDTGCSVADASDLNLVSPLYTYNSNLNVYEDADSRGGLKPWQGAWFATRPENGTTQLFLEPPGLETKPPIEVTSSPYSSVEITAAGLQAKAADLSGEAQVHVAAEAETLDSVSISTSTRLFGHPVSLVVGGVSLVFDISHADNAEQDEIHASIFDGSPVNRIVSCSPADNQCSVVPTYTADSGEQFFTPEERRHFLAIKQ